jgi:glycosyltransferase involved in cell wall biosynthesis
MQAAANCAAVIPCHNEAAAIARVVAATRCHVATVIVVDDGSCDETAALAEVAGALVIRHEQRRGKGAALKSGFQRARELGFTSALTLDGDGQHAADDIPKFFALAESSRANLIVGNRMGDAAKMPWLRRAVNRLMSRILSRMAGQPLPDSQCGFRLLNLGVWSALQADARNFEFESEQLLAFARAGHAIRFVSVQVIYRDERSKIAPLRDTWRWFRWLNQARRAA